MPHASGTTSTSDVAANRTRPGRSPREGRGWFVLRKAHGLAGVAILGTFVVGHLVAQSHAMWQAAGDGFGDTRTAPVLAGGWRAAVLVPLAFHVGLGLLILARTRFNVARYPFGSNWTYTLQRITAILALAFLVLHAVDVVVPLARGTLSHQDLYRAMTARLSSTRAGVPWWALGYMLGIGACAFHLGAGVRSAARSLGLVTRPAAMGRAALLGAFVGLATLALGANATVFLATGSAVDWPFATTGPAAEKAVGVACPDATGHAAADGSAATTTGRGRESAAPSAPPSAQPRSAPGAPSTSTARP